VARVQDDVEAEGTLPGGVGERRQMPPRLRSPGDSARRRDVLLGRAGRASLQRADERETQGEGNGEQQYE
jgi:hypothetical protein